MPRRISSYNRTSNWCGTTTHLETQMYIQTLRLAIVLAAFIIAVPASAQDCGCNQGGSYGAYGAYGSQDNCGRGISQQQAEGLWAGYCNESCGYQGGGSNRGGCSLGSRLHGGVGCNSGGFGYPSGGGCGGGKGCLGGKGCGCKLFGGRHGGGGCGAGAVDSCGTGSCGGGCGTSSCDSGSCGGGSCGGGSCGGGCKLKSLCSGCKLFGGGCCKFKQSAQACGTNGAYFQEAVGYEYGTAGIESCVSCSGGMSSYDTGSYDMGVPTMMAPAQPMSVIDSGVQDLQPMMQHAPVQDAPLMMEPVVGAIESIGSGTRGN